MEVEVRPLQAVAIAEHGHVDAPICAGPEITPEVEMYEHMPFVGIALSVLGVVLTAVGLAVVLVGRGRRRAAQTDRESWSPQPGHSSPARMEEPRTYSGAGSILAPKVPEAAFVAWDEVPADAPDLTERLALARDRELPDVQLVVIFPDWGKFEIHPANGSVAVPRELLDDLRSLLSWCRDQAAQRSSGRHGGATAEYGLIVPVHDLVDVALEGVVAKVVSLRWAVEHSKAVHVLPRSASGWRPTRAASGTDAELWPAREWNAMLEVVRTRLLLAERARTVENEAIVVHPVWGLGHHEGRSIIISGQLLTGGPSTARAGVLVGGLGSRRSWLCAEITPKLPVEEARASAERPEPRLLLSPSVTIQLARDGGGVPSEPAIEVVAHTGRRDLDDELLTVQGVWRERIGAWRGIAQRALTLTAYAAGRALAVGTGHGGRRAIGQMIVMPVGDGLRVVAFRTDPRQSLEEVAVVALMRVLPVEIGEQPCRVAVPQGDEDLDHWSQLGFRPLRDGEYGSTGEGLAVELRRPGADSE